ncbi:MAG TPA: hypothetical protein VK017_11175 [Sphingobacterium sp.]|nr:hypothetical protein [Sphingobacterium sp.]
MSKDRKHLSKNLLFPDKSGHDKRPSAADKLYRGRWASASVIEISWHRSISEGTGSPNFIRILLYSWEKIKGPPKPAWAEKEEHGQIKTAKIRCRGKKTDIRLGRASIFYTCRRSFFYDRNNRCPKQRGTVMNSTFCGRIFGGICSAACCHAIAAERAATFCVAVTYFV